MTEHIIGAVNWRLKGQRLRFEPQKRPIPLYKAESENRSALTREQLRIKKEFVIYTAQMLIHQSGNEKREYYFIKDLKNIIGV